MAAPHPAPDTALDTATAIAAAVRAGDLTAREATEAALTRIAERDSVIGAFQVVRAEAALREADAVDQRADRFSLPLAGVPIAIKDNVAVSGEPMRIGSAGSDETPSEFDHEVVRRLRRAGAVVVGLTRVPELCVYGATDSVFGITRNPWDLDRTPGGSSGGAAAAVAAGMIVAAHGNDGMGSIRIPSACCGLVGIKPGLGVVPAGLGNGSWFDMAENGPLATTVADCAALLSVLAGRPELAEVDEPSALRIAVSTRNPIQGFRVDRSWADAAPAAGGVLREAGHTVRQANPPYGPVLGPSSLARWMAGTELDARLLADRSRLARRTSAHATAGRLLLRAGFPKDAGRDRWRRRAEAFFADHDVLVTPALAQSPIPSIAWSERGWLANLLASVRYAPFAAPWNVAGWPAIAVPTGVGADGMPRAVQLVGRPGSEATLLGLAAQIERRRPWPRVAPSYSPAHE
jgi:amidase